jgi:hypothetical protein
MNLILTLVVTNRYYTHYFVLSANTCLRQQSHQPLGFIRPAATMKRMELDLNALTEAYLRNLRGSDKDFRAWEEARRLIEDDPEAAWRVTLLLLEKVESDTEAEYIAAGPLEDFIDFHGDTALGRIDEVIDRNQRLQLALSTVGVLYYYDEFDRWYDLLYRYGYRKDRVGNRSIIADAMKVMKAYMDESINVHDYGRRLTELLDKPFEDKKAQRILQQRCLDIELMEIQRLLNDREPYLEEPELKQRVAETLAELEALGYKGST